MNRKRYINVTLVDVTGAPSSTQILTSDPLDALEYINRRVHGPRTGLNDTDIIAAFMFDTDGGTLRQFDVVNIAGLHKINER